MADITPYAISSLFTELTGHDVSVSLVSSPAASKVCQLYGVYSSLPSGRPIVVKTDLAILAVLAGGLLGLPPATAVERALQTPMDECLRDAIHEILNITSTVLSTGERVVFSKMTLDAVYCEGAAADLLKKPDLKSSFLIKIKNQPDGVLTVLEQF